MYKTATIVIKNTNPLFAVIDDYAFLCKNLKNSALYAYRQFFFKENKTLNKYKLIKEFTQDKQADYVAIPRKVSQQIIFQVAQEFQSFWGLVKLGVKDKSKPRPNIPRYLDKQKVNNQKFVNIPFATLLNMITYKAKEKGVQVIITNENHTSKCSFLDDEPIQKQSTYKGRRIKRGLFKSSNGRLINADVNGAMNILKKVIGNFNYNPIQVCSTPKIINILKPWTSVIFYILLLFG